MALCCRFFWGITVVLLLGATVHAQDGPVDAYIAWTEKIDGQEQVFLSHLKGGHWSEAEQLSSSQTTAFWPAVASYGQGRTWVVWSQYDRAGNGTSSLYSITRTTNGSWSEPERINTGLGKNTKAELVVDGQGIPWLAWEGITERYPDIYLSSWSAGGWTTPLKMNDPNKVPDLNPRLFIDEHGSVCLAWKTFSENGYVPVAECLTGTGWINIPNAGVDEKESMLTDARALRLPPFIDLVQDKRQGRIFLRTRENRMFALPLTDLSGK